MATTQPIRRSWFSFSLRTLLIVVAIWGIGIVWWQRSSKFAELSAQHSVTAQHFADAAWGTQRFSGFSEESNRQAQPLWEAYAYHDWIAKKYRYASWLPFVPLGEPVEEERE
jgi:hypothetical protein